MSDQHAPRVAGCYGNTAARTPHLDGLADRGTRFDAAYTPSPICVPARAALATGRYVHHTGNWDNAAPFVGLEAASWGHRLSDAGVRVATFGKLHYRAEEDPSGFDEQHRPLHVKNGIGDVSQLLRGDRPPSHGLRDVIQGAGPGESDYTRYDRDVAREASEWISSAAGGEEPWCAMVSFVSPHYPLVAPPEYFARFEDVEIPAEAGDRPSEWDQHPNSRDYRRRCRTDEPFPDATVRRARAAYYALTEFMDAQLGRVLDALETSGQAEETLVIYTSDHGESLGAHGLWFKSTMHETAVRVPMIVAAPGQRRRVCQTPASLVDLFPTILGWHRVPLAEADRDLPGRDLLGISEEPYDENRAVFSEYHAIHSTNAGYALRQGRWKFHYSLDAPHRLFDIVNDPEELIDLIDESAYADVIARLTERLRSIVDPEALDARVKADQRRRLDELGGRDAVLGGNFFAKPFTPIPSEGRGAVS